MKTLTGRHGTSIVNIQKKLEYLKHLIEADRCAEWAGRPSFDQFCRWADESLGITACAKSNFTYKSAERGQNDLYAALKAEIISCLLLLEKKLENSKSKPGKSRSLQSLELKNKELERRCQQYINEYISARDQLLETQKALAISESRRKRLEEQLGSKERPPRLFKSPVS